MTVSLDVTLGAIGLDKPNIEKKTHLRLQAVPKPTVPEQDGAMEYAARKRGNPRTIACECHCQASFFSKTIRSEVWVKLYQI